MKQFKNCCQCLWKVNIILCWKLMLYPIYSTKDETSAATGDYWLYDYWLFNEMKFSNFLNLLKFVALENWLSSSWYPENRFRLVSYSLLNCFNFTYICFRKRFTGSNLFQIPLICVNMNRKLVTVLKAYCLCVVHWDYAVYCWQYL